MKEIELSPDFVKKIKQIRKNNKFFYNKIVKQLSLFQKEPQHPSLRTHKLKGKLQNTWSVSIDKKNRMIYYENEVYYFYGIGSHDEVYRK